MDEGAAGSLDSGGGGLSEIGCSGCGFGVEALGEGPKGSSPSSSSVSRRRTVDEIMTRGPLALGDGDWAGAGRSPEVVSEVVRLDCSERA